jgi:NhaP-type Na+/H+ or K+/H+ antiporter/rhodanese-related sulfurtransferase
VELFTVTVALIGVVILVASLLSGALERSGLPVVAVFLALGVIVGPYGLGLADVDFASPSLRALSVLALALVLFSDAATMDMRALRDHRSLLWTVLGPGTLIPAILIATAARLLLDVPTPAAAILGAALASTDPVLLRAVLRSPALPEPARVALRMESGTNDIILLPVVVLAIVALGPAEGAVHGPARSLSATLVGLFLLGPALGMLVGGVGITVLDRVRDSLGVRRDYESLYALGLAFTAFAAAEAVGGSGFVAAFAAGLLVAALDVELCDCFLEYGEATAEMLLLLTFVALGTTLIWTGLTVVDGPTLIFAAVALVARTAVLYPVLAGARVAPGERRLIALLGPRGLSTLLLVLLPVFAGVAGAERLFAVSCLVVLLSVLIHGAGIGLFMARGRATTPPPAATARAAPAPRPPTASLPVLDGDEPAIIPELITLAELSELRATGAPVIVADVRADRNYGQDDFTAAGAVRIHPERAIADATRLALPREATLAVFCACVNEVTALRVTRALRKAGWPRARALVGGWQGWVDAGLPLARKVPSALGAAETAP